MAADDRPRVYADAVLFIDVLQGGGSPVAESSLQVLEAAERHDIQLIASRLLAAEIGRFRGDRDRSSVDQLVLRYLDSVNAEWVEVDLLVARDARRLSWQHNIKSGADSVHLATAVRRRADYFMSRDGAFPYGLRVDDVTAVTLPQVVWTPTLYD